MTQLLELVFELANGKSLTLSIPNPKANLTDNEINAAMQTIVTSNVFVREGAAITAKKGARIVERGVTEFKIN
ncbi:MAG: DUF2922 domain-containing protein [Lysinibacillus sp.]